MPAPGRHASEGEGREHARALDRFLSVLSAATSEEGDGDGERAERRVVESGHWARAGGLTGGAGKEGKGRLLRDETRNVLFFTTNSALLS